MSHRLGIVLVLAFCSASLASAQVPAGEEFVVATPQSSYFHLRTPSIVSDGLGRFVVAWTSHGCRPEPIFVCVGQDGGVGSWNAMGVFARRYDASGAPLGSEFQVNTYTTGQQHRPAAASDTSGNLVLVWEGQGSGDGGGIFAQLLDASGAARGSEFRVNSYTTWHQGYPAVAADASGNFVVAWRSFGQDGDDMGVFAQRYDASGAPRGGEFQVNTHTTGHQGNPAVASDALGNFVVVWEDRATDADPAGRGVYAQRYDASGAPRGSEFRVNTYGSFVTWADPKIASDPAGNLVIAWTSWQPAETSGIRAQLYDASGAPRGSEFQVDDDLGGVLPSLPGGPSVGTDAAGNFAVVWNAWRPTGAFGGMRNVSARRFDASGAPRGAEFLVREKYSWDAPVVATDATGNLVSAWLGWVDTLGDSAVVARRFGNLEPVALAVDPGASAGFRGAFGNGVLEPGEAVAVRPFFRNLNGLLQTVTFDGVASSLTGPPAAGVGYQLVDAAASYGPIANGATTVCSDCYRVGVFYGGVRPALHWDATLVEELSLDPPAQALTRSLHIGESFADVPRTSPYYRFVETVLHRGITAGCSGTDYCPTAAVTREQMAVFTLAGRHGAGYGPPFSPYWGPCEPLFDDVPASSPFCPWIAELTHRGVVSGCGGGNYCPGNPVTREQMPIFVLKTLDPALDPPACTTPVFADVPASSPYCRFIEELARRGVVSGCGGGNYCPGDPVTREQMAVFISQTFGLSLYGP